MTVTVHAETGKTVAKALLRAGCVTLADEPFRLPSGWASPVWHDCRRLISFPRSAARSCRSASSSCGRGGSLAGVASIAGGETSGIALAAWFAEVLDLPLSTCARRRSADPRSKA